MISLTINTSSPALGGLLTATYLKDGTDIDIKYGKENILKMSPNHAVDSDATICRFLARHTPQLQLYGSCLEEEIEVDHWIAFSIGPLSCTKQFSKCLQYLDHTLSSLSYLVGHQLTVADFIVWGTLYGNQSWRNLPENMYKNISRWFSFIESLPKVVGALNNLPKEKADTKVKGECKSNESRDVGKFVDLPGAKKGEVVVRFPPEASGYLHIGHAKAALLNQYYQELFEGKLIMRFDDTNPEKEKVDFEKVILEDLKLLQINPDQFTHTSDYFDLLLEMCVKLLKEGRAYIDDTDPEVMKQEREQRKASKNRENSVEKNLSMWAEMVKGSEYGQKCCARAKIDMESDNGCMRDPTIYRCKNEPHPRKGSSYKVYPTYDFACPIVDSIEGVTHALRTMEYHDRDEQFYWFIDALKLRKPYIWEYSRLNMMNTVLSKRKLTWFVDEKIVDSWEDPRLPTVRGVIRRGLTVEGLKQFIIAQGSSRSVVQMEWDKIWAFNKKIIDPIAPRYTALRKGVTVPVNVSNAKPNILTVNKHPKNPSVGTKNVPTGPKVLIEMTDAEQLREGENATFINWGNLKIKKINRDSKGVISSIDAETNLEDTDFKKTLKLTWLIESPNSTPVEVLFYNHIITKPVLGKDDDFKKFVNHNSKKLVEYIGDEDLKALRVGDILQLQRIGFFRCDVAYQPNRPVVLIHIPDGSSKIPFLGEEDLSGKGSLPQSTDKKSKEIGVKKSKDSGEKKSKETGDKKTDSDSKFMPVSNQELEQIAVQWRKDRESNLVKAKSPAKEPTIKTPKPQKPAKASTTPDKAKKDGKQSRTRLGLEATREDNLPEWYSQVITKGELIEYYDISGCYILRPWSFALWETIQAFLDKGIKALGVQNCYFPIFVSKSVLEKEKNHISDFAPEVAWVTKSGDSDLAEHIAVRPTSETVMYPAFSKWIQSYRDLPIKLNQWSNVVRWEFKHPQPFLRTREFLWQEGHTAYASYKEAEVEVYQILDLYASVYSDLLAVPVVKGWKTKKEKFAGSDFTTTVEAFISASGRGIQAATSHHLGQNFSKMFDILYEDPETKDKKFVYQNSWGMTTRTIGIMVMIHADNKGLVLPPRAASLQVVIVACGVTVNLSDGDRKTLFDACKNLEKELISAEIRAKFDDRDNYSPGWKFNHWELKGVPVRVELGPNDLQKGQLIAVRRDNGEKIVIELKNKIPNLKNLLEEIQSNMYNRAMKELKAHTVILKDWSQFCSALDGKNIILAPFCEEESCEDNIKKDSARDENVEPGAPVMGAKSLCIPFDQPEAIGNNDKCIHPSCKNKPVRFTLFGRSY
ncbi:hypothetical protein RUM43_006817 [Polyplax serrata]|uniref:Glutamate--tRNA ligase n=1 Tax=Polyplax serrata TaxID=468196 RepID=A0AAN8S544_POLSC